MIMGKLGIVFISIHILVNRVSPKSSQKALSVIIAVPFRLHLQKLR